MINFSDGYSKEFKIIINNTLDEIFDFFMEVGSNLHYEEIYATVFPIHKQDDHEYGMNKLKILLRNIRDDFQHQLTPLDEYVLYHVLYFVYDSSDDEYNLDDIISKQLTDEVVKKIENVEPDGVKLLRNTHTPYDVIGIIFEDVDFLRDTGTGTLSHHFFTTGLVWWLHSRYMGMGDGEIDKVKLYPK
ncbi:hypothetical protein J2S25_004105 [Mesobacillus stamsii]|uniref:Uncharacterized protein n=2 Tax=Mesobacillus stamsii TaxID=225347 RepID=A0ABU0G0V3_9BACI|nr:hypothetical protein [Mesobacillus stamsii]